MGAKVGLAVRGSPSTSGCVSRVEDGSEVFACDF